MKIVIAPDSFKECLSSTKVAQALACGWKKILPHTEIVCIPIADGGEGTLEAMVFSTNGTILEREVMDPLNRPIIAKLGILGESKTAIIEMAQASGIELLMSHERNPLVTSTYGTGQLIKAALEYDIEEIIVCLGGSATNDGGVGMMMALGVRFIDYNNEPIPYGGMGLAKIKKIDLTRMDPRLANIKFTAACDVNNPLTGPNGASYVFGKQKGASPHDIALLDDAMKNYAKCISEQLGIEVENIPGVGAAGGIGCALVAFLNAELKSGIDIILNALNFKMHLTGASLVITGEGKLDSQTLQGKAPVGVARLALEQCIPTIAIAGSVDRSSYKLHDAGIMACFSILNKPCSLKDALNDGAINLEQMGEALAGFYKALHSNRD